MGWALDAVFSAWSTTIASDDGGKPVPEVVTPEQVRFR